MKGTVWMIMNAFPDNHHEVEEVTAEGETVVLRCTLTGTHEGEFMGLPPTGRRIEVTEIHPYRLEGGKAVEHRVGRDDTGGDAPAGRHSGLRSEPGPPRDAVGNA